MKDGRIRKKLICRQYNGLENIRKITKYENKMNVLMLQNCTFKILY